MTKLEKRIEELEKRVRELEARPLYIPYVITYPGTGPLPEPRVDPCWIPQAIT